MRVRREGLFRADLAIGNDGSRSFVLIEFEGGEEASLFSGGTRQYRHWSRQIEHGFGQVVDWGWAKHDHPYDAAFTNAFGGKVVDDSYIVICGRDPVAGSLEERRFDFRRSRLSERRDGAILHLRWHGARDERQPGFDPVVMRLTLPAPGG
ncbi:Shedu anti-phage system protein SduA domain-containing protein [Methylorubrum suomiense]